MKTKGKSHGFYRFLSDTFLFSACLLMLISTLLPFLTVNHIWRPIPQITRFANSYWSFKALSGSSRYVYFDRYWFGSYTYLNGISTFLIGMFLSQVFAFAIGLVSLIKIPRARIISFISSLIVIILMIMVFVQIDKATFPFITTYGLGYWMAYPSMLLFLLASILRTEKK